MPECYHIASNVRQRTAMHFADSYPFAAPLGLAIVLLAMLVAYLPSMEGGVLLDDKINLTRPELQSLDGLFSIWFDPAETARFAQYYPLVHSAFWIEHKLWGDSYLGYHLVNVLFHSLSVLLLYSILVKLEIPGAFLAAAIFALHPVMVESVAWMSEQKNTLSGVFYLSAVLVYLGFDEARRRWRYFVALGLFALALFAKTSTVTLPAALLIIFWWKRGRLSWRNDVLPLVPFFALSIASGLMTMWVEWKLVGAEGSEFALGFLGRTVLAGRVIWFYLAKLFCPNNLTFIYPRWNIDAAQWWQWLFPVAVLLVTISWWAIRKHSRAPLAAWLFFCVTLFPVLGFLNVYFFMYSFVADHLQYLASMGIIAVVAAGIATGLARVAPSARFVGVGSCVVLTSLLTFLTWRQSHIYADASTLYGTTIDRNPDCWVAHHNLGLELASQGKLDEAMAQYRSAIAIKPDYGLAHSSLGNVYASLGRMPEAIAEFQAALANYPDSPVFHSNLSSALIPLGRLQEAIDHAREALRHRPDYFEARYNLGTALFQANRLPEASAELREALKLRPDDAVALNTAGAVFLQAGFHTEAIEYIERALKLRPTFAAARNNLGQAYARAGKIPQAIEQFQLATEQDKHFADAHVSWGLTLTAQNKFDESISHFEKAIQLGANRPDVRNNLGDSYRKSGQTDKAIEQYEIAVRQNPSFMLAQANLAQTLALVDRAKEAVAAAQKAIEVARSTGQQDELSQFEEWLTHYRIELQRAGDAASSGSTSQAQGPARTQ